MILVTGVNGNVGGELAGQLVDRGVPVRALTHSAVPRSLEARVESAVGDLNDPGSLGDALHGVDAVFLLPGYDDMSALVAAIAAAGIGRIVLLSGGSAGSRDMTNAVTAYMVRSEDAVRASDVEWTILRPAAFMANALRWKDKLTASNVLRLPFADVRTAVVDPGDIAAVAAVALLEPDHAGQVYVPTGPESLRPADQVEILARTLDRALQFEAQPDDEARTEMLKSTPVEYVDAFFDFYVAGALDESQVRPTVRELTGRDPRSFEDWARRHAAEFS